MQCSALPIAGVSNVLFPTLLQSRFTFLSTLCHALSGFAQGEALSLAHSFFVPPLKVRKDWFEGLNPDPIDHNHPDVGNLADAEANGDDEVCVHLSQFVGLV